MAYIQELEARLNLLLEDVGVPTEDRAPIIAELTAIVLDSYRNGARAGAGAVARRNRSAGKTGEAAHVEN